MIKRRHDRALAPGRWRWWTSPSSDNVQMFSFASFDEIDTLVTDTRVDPEAVEFLTTQGITVHRA